VKVAIIGTGFGQYAAAPVYRKLAAARIRRGVLPGEGDVVFDFPPPDGEAHEPALVPWFGRVKQALQAGAQIAPSFDDGLAVAEAMDQLRANAIQVGLPDEIRPS
jgi:hypothetical protein